MAQGTSIIQIPDNRLSKKHETFNTGRYSLIFILHASLPISIKLENNGRVMKTEVKNDHVLFYLETVFGTANHFTFSVEQTNLVSNIQPAPVMVYDYYEKDEYALVSYNINSVSVSQ
uniref:Alpha-macroglobulin receptor-binding domain-containing protein n=1 Tax=Ailuropoda melanoleuca TaxID=9646 RepID=A0A7N5K9M5_AILME